MNIRKCRFCDKILNVRQMVFCSQSCHFKDLNNSKEKWTINITPELHDIIEGVLLSDGSLELGKTCKYPRLVVTQSSDHLEYLKFLANKLNLDEDRITPRKKYNKRYEKFYESYVLATKTSPVWSEYYRRWYPNGKKVIPDDFHLNETVLLHEYLGDGCLESYISNKNFGSQKYYRIRLHTQCFSSDEVHRHIINPLASFGIDSSYERRKSLVIGKQASVYKFIDLIKLNPVHCYDYKFGCINSG